MQASENANKEAIVLWCDQIPGRPSAHYTQWCMCMCGVCVAALSLLTHREKVVMATLSRGVMLGWWLLLPNNTAKANPCVCVCFWVSAGHTIVVCRRVFSLVACVCAFQSWEPRSLSSIWRGSSCCFQSSSSFWLTLLWYYLFIQSHVYKERLTGILCWTSFTRGLLSANLRVSQKQ